MPETSSLAFGSTLTSWGWWIETQIQFTALKVFRSTLTSWGWWIETSLKIPVFNLPKVPLSLVGGGGLKQQNMHFFQHFSTVPLSLVGGGGLKQSDYLCLCCLLGSTLTSWGWWIETPSTTREPAQFKFHSH